MKRALLLLAQALVLGAAFAGMLMLILLSLLNTHNAGGFIP